MKNAACSCGGDDLLSNDTKKILQKLDFIHLKIQLKKKCTNVPQDPLRLPHILLKEYFTIFAT